MIRNLFRHAANIPALAIGVLVGATMLSGVAVAAAPGLVTIADPSGANKASVNGAGQLLAAEANPRNTVVFFGQTSTALTCAHVYTVPAGKALIIKSISFLTGKSSTSPEVDVYRNGCVTLLTFATPSTTTPTWGSTQQTFPLGLPVASGKTVDLYCHDTSTCYVSVVGYLVPSILVPASATTDTTSAPVRAGSRTPAAAR